MSDCVLSDRGRALSTILSSFASMIITGVNNGAGVAFLTAWICWFAAVRNVYTSGKGLIVSLSGGAFGIKAPFLRPAHDILPTEEPKPEGELTYFGKSGDARVNGYRHVESEDRVGLTTNLQAIHQLPTPGQNEPASTAYAGGGGAGGEYFSQSYQPQSVPLNGSPGRSEVGQDRFRLTPGPVPVQRMNQFFLFTKRDSESVTVLGWIGWVYAFVWTPISNILWTFSNWSSAGNLLHLSRAITIGVSALSYTIDTQARYGVALGRRVGNDSIIPRTFSIFTALSNCVLSANTIALLIRAATQTNDEDDLDKQIHDPLTPNGLAAPLPLIIIFPIFSIIWALASYKLIGTEDAGWKQTWKGRIAGLAMGAFGGAFVAAPAFAAMNSGFAALEDPSTPAAELGDYLRCSSVAWWQKMVQILP